MHAGGLIEGVAHATVAEIAAARGDRAAAQDGFARARALMGAEASATWAGWVDAGAAEIELSAGRPARARDAVAQAVAWSEGHEFPF